jgi:hypothetical protein
LSIAMAAGTAIDRHGKVPDFSGVKVLGYYVSPQRSLRDYLGLQVAVTNARTGSYPSLKDRRNSLGLHPIFRLKYLVN